MSKTTREGPKVIPSNVDNQDDSYQSGNMTVTNLVTNSYQSGNQLVTNLVTNSYQSGNYALNIEDFPTLIPSLISLPSLPSSNFPTEQTVDNSADTVSEDAEPEEVHIAVDELPIEFEDSLAVFDSVLAFDSKWYAEKFVEMVTAFGIEENHPGILADFADSLLEAKQRNLDVAMFGLLWAEWRKNAKYRFSPNVPNIDHLTDAP